MTISFAKCLQAVRNDKQITQQEALDTLISSDESLSKLDLTTYSRWERGVTKPKLSKQLLVARILGADSTSLIDPEANAPEKKRQVLDYVHSRTKDPYSKSSADFTAYQDISLKDKEDLHQQIVTFHTDYLQQNLEPSALLNDNLHVNVFVDGDNKLVGHMIYGYVEIDTPSVLLNPNKLEECPFVNEERRPDLDLALYLVSMYCSLIPPRMVAILSLIELLKQNQNIKHLYANLHDQEGYNLYNSNVECTVLTKGNQEPYGGVKVYGKHYRYVQIKANADEILASKVIANIVPFTDEYLSSLLDGTGSDCSR
ncbi:XRE family transcriptional regulator [Vibrio sp. RE86]|uniref:helix-turn-helix transcriptional regulator n=1 Tax=Vibrio sp. RE86 TaxID=2607605 RepID=UPI001493A4FD|nr:helix-turn-helix transcriptional regulator [Vibrio sp. RE86]NOH79972.1 XRE family transcriptional regulator [Vibrio sp. RE86]